MVFIDKLCFVPVFSDQNSDSRDTGNKSYEIHVVCNLAPPIIQTQIFQCDMHHIPTDISSKQK